MKRRIVFAASVLGVAGAVGFFAFGHRGAKLLETPSAQAQPITVQTYLDDLNAGCSGPPFGCGPDRTFGGKCDAGFHRKECVVKKIGGTGNCFAGRKHPKLDTANIWAYPDDPHDCTCYAHAGADWLHSVQCEVTITEEGATPPQPTCPDGKKCSAGYSCCLPCGGDKIQCEPQGFCDRREAICDPRHGK